MPQYCYRCECGTKFDRILCLADYNKPQTCECGKVANKILTPHYAIPDIQPYQSVITGEYIGSRSKHASHLRQHNCIEVGNEKMTAPKMPETPGLKKDIINSYKKLGGRF